MKEEFLFPCNCITLSLWKVVVENILKLVDLIEDVATLVPFGVIAILDISM